MNSKTILIVDDKASDISSLEAMLKPEGYLTSGVSSGNGALNAVMLQQPDMFLINSELPDMDGYYVATKFKHSAITKHIPIIMMSSLGDQPSKLVGLNSGAEEFIQKPVDGTELRLRVKNLLRLKEHSDLLDRINHHLESQVRSRTEQLHASHVETIDALIRAAEHRDDDTGTHVRRISHYSRHMAETLEMDSYYCDKIYYASAMHDIGKISIPDHILLKPSSHTAEEFELMKTHCMHGASILQGFSSPYLKMGTEIALCHHERWDGTGYPAGLAGDGIPLAARIMSVCDVYDALRAKRPYKPAFNHERCMKIIVDGDGRTMPGHFDPAVLSAFERSGDRFNEIYMEHE